MSGGKFEVGTAVEVRTPFESEENGKRGIVVHSRDGVGNPATFYAVLLADASEPVLVAESFLSTYDE